MKNTLYFLVCPLLLFWGCQTVVETDLPEHEPKLVVNAVFNTDSLFTVEVSASKSAFSNEEHAPVEGAVVGLWQAEKYLFDLQHTGRGIYKADQKPETGQHYMLKVSAPGFPEAGAAAYMPAEPLISDVRAGKGPVHYDWQGPTVNASFILEDPAEQENFYYMKVYTPDSSYDKIPFNKYVMVISSSPIEEEFSMGTRYFFSDRLFNGQALQLSLNLDNHPQNTTYIQVAHITREYYQYVRTLEKQSYNDRLNLSPVTVTNNIVNGIGLFAGVTVKTIKIKP